MTTRFIDTDQARKMLYRYLAAQPLPLTVSIERGKKRTTDQNRLNRQWMLDISEQLGWEPEYARGYCKLHFGIPILRNANEAFAQEYDEVIRPLSYEHKLKLMMVPFDFGVTRLMTVKQETAYLDAVQKHFAEQGVVLTDPDALSQVAA